MPLPARGIDAAVIADVQATVRRRLLGVMTRRGLLAPEEAKTMAAWDHGGGFSVDAEVRIAADDREGLERLLRYCARPAFALERLREINSERLVYESVKPGPGGNVSVLLTAPTPGSSGSTDFSLAKSQEISVDLKHGEG